MTQQVNELSELVKTLAQESHESRSALREYDARIQALDLSTERSREDFAANSKYLIYVTPTQDPKVKEIADYLVQELAQLGYKTTRWTWKGGSESDKLTVAFDYAPGEDVLAQRVASSVTSLLLERQIEHVTRFREDHDTRQKQGVVWVFLS